MKKLAFAMTAVSILAVGTVADAASNKTTGLVGGAVAGAIAAGPVGAVIGGVTGYQLGKEVDRYHHRHVIIRKHHNN